MKSANGGLPLTLSLQLLIFAFLLLNSNATSILLLQPQAIGSLPLPLPVPDASRSQIHPTMLPLMQERLVMVNESRRKLGSFQICALCTCCGGAKGLCLASPCCYAINCNIPNRPFGFCSFTPKTCNCFGCHI